ncbi:sulfatase-like hydrolase/transferase [Akkermansiaceae bacterium]|nr:sulfatase-like hydrolase/transferase [Akkermansiaceae bacterium]
MASLFLVSCAALSAGRMPNVIVVFTDDQGYADIGANGLLADIRTPHIDALAASGVRCTAGYISAPQCSPSRAGLITGRHQQRFGFDTIPDGPLPLEEVTLAERLKALGYATGQVGKWHLEPNRLSLTWARKACPEAIKGNELKPPAALIQRYMPGAQGFDDFFTGEMNRYFANYNLDGSDAKLGGETKVFPEEKFRVDLQTDAALAFIGRNHAKQFFLYLNYYAPHVPLAATEKYLSRFAGEMPERRRTALAMMSAIDEGVGKIRAVLDSHGLTDDTMIFYISDNGAPLGAQSGDGAMADILPVGKPGAVWDGSRNDPLTGEKGMLMEGGIRVPFVVSWPAKFPRGAVHEKPVISLDIAATAMAAATGKVPDGLDGVDLAAVFSGQDSAERSLHWRFWNQAAIRRGKWKYLTMGDGTEILVDLEVDIAEANNLIAAHPGVAAGLKADLDAWTQGLKPKGLPTAKPNDQERKWYRHYLGRE